MALLICAGAHRGEFGKGLDGDGAAELLEDAGEGQLGLGGGEAFEVGAGLVPVAEGDVGLEGGDAVLDGLELSLELGLFFLLEALGFELFGGEFRGVGIDGDFGLLGFRIGLGGAGGLDAGLEDAGGGAVDDELLEELLALGLGVVLVVAALVALGVVAGRELTRHVAGFNEDTGPFPLGNG